MNDDEWYYSVDGSTQLGPVAKDAIIALLDDKTLTLDSLVWNPDLDGWTPIRDVSSIEWNPPPTPPPLPPPLPKQELDDIDQLAKAISASPTPKGTPKKGDRSLNGLGGWLWLVGIQVFFLPLGIVSHLGVMITTPEGESHPIWGPVLSLTGVDIVLFSGLIFVSLYILYLFFNERRAFPKWYMGTLAIGGFIAVESFGSHVDGGGDPVLWLGKNLMHLVGCAVGILYMLVSKRVKATFVK